MSGRVVIVGGSVAGLACAATLAPHVEQVLVVDKGTEVAGMIAAQARMPHVLLSSGATVLEGCLPGFSASLIRGGASTGGPDPQRVPVHWPGAGSVRRELRMRALGFPRALAGRRAVEPELRRRVLALPNVGYHSDALVGLLESSGRVAGVRLREAGSVDADLVIDATGRSTTVHDLLGDPPEPATTQIGIDLRYVGFVVERRAGDVDDAEVVVVQNTADVPRIGVALPLGRDRWHIVLGAYFGVDVPTDAAGASAFAATLADPALVPLLRRDPVEPPRRYTFRASLRRHWDRPGATVPGLVAVGDSVASFNPIYGQGMSSALLQARALADLVGERGLGDGFERAAAARLGRIVEDPWTVSAGGDFAYRQTTGRRPPGHRVIRRYIDRVMRASASDPVVNLAWTEVQQLLAPPASLFRPQVMARVLGRAGVVERGGRAVGVDRASVGA